MNTQEYEVNIHSLLYRTCRKWRGILLVAVAAAVLFALRVGIPDAKVLLNKEQYDAAREVYEIERSAWKSNGTVLAHAIETQQIAKQRQEEYNEKSLLMKIDPMNEYKGSFSIYVDSGYQLDPTLGLQNIDYTQRILSAYNKYLHGGELYEYLLDSLDYVDEQVYLKEILSASADIESSMVSVTVIGKNEEEVDTILELVKSGLADKYETVNNSIGKHTYSVVYETGYYYVNYDLEDTQKGNIDAIDKYNDAIRSANENLEKWKAEKRPSFRYNVSSVVKRAIKNGIFGGVLGAAAAVFFTVAVFLLGQSFYEDKLSMCASEPVRIIGEISGGKKLRGIDRLIARLFREKTEYPGTEASCALAGTTAQNTLVADGRSRLALVGHADRELLESITAGMNNSADEIDIRLLGDILDDPAAILELENYDSVALVLEEKKNTLAQVRRQFELLSLWKKNVLGAIIVK